MVILQQYISVVSCCYSLEDKEDKIDSDESLIRLPRKRRRKKRTQSSADERGAST
jgi:hypothetical protein